MLYLTFVHSLNIRLSISAHGESYRMIPLFLCELCTTSVYVYVCTTIAVNSMYVCTCAGVSTAEYPGAGGRSHESQVRPDSSETAGHAHLW